MSSKPRPPPILGAETFPCTTLTTSLALITDSNLSFLLLPLVHPRLQRHSLSKRQQIGTTAYRAETLQRPLTRSDLSLTSAEWSSMIVGRLSLWTGDFDTQGEGALKEGMELAEHLGLAAVMGCPLKGFNDDEQQQEKEEENVFVNDHYARAISEELKRGVHVWIQVKFGHWHEWNRFRLLCDCASNLHVALVLEDDLPRLEEGTGRDLVLERWLGEPVRAVVIPMGLFIANASGFPTLGLRHKNVIIAEYLRNAQFVLTGRPRHANGLVPYQMYISHVCQTGTPSMLTEREEFEANWYDYLQIPLQPLGDNLESNTYEVFERDPVKYARYREAVRRALVRASSIRPSDAQLVIMVVGAGRGPLVRESLAAAEAAGLLDRVHVYAVEKNANAVVTLLNSKRDAPRWDGRVTIVSSDMRRWHAPALADVVVSELLGSWGDNELSPECLAGVERFIRPQIGVSIPFRYTSYMAPIQSHRVWSSVRDLLKLGGTASPWSKTALDPSLARFDTPYVVRLFNHVLVSDPKQVFVFEHGPSRNNNNNNIVRDEVSETTKNNNNVKEEEEEELSTERFSRLAFNATCDAAVHGFAGYFDADLYEDVGYSIHPQTYSEGMFSWFPLFLPLRSPVTVQQGDTIVVSVWRKRDSKRVWYEWSTTFARLSNVFHVTPVQNSGGVASHVSL